ncbi:DAK2 domain-containing protein [Actinoplanes sp. NPDC000266]
MLETLDVAAVRRWCGGGLQALRAHQREIDELNVYPVPDGDTGTNLVLTLTSAQEALDASEAHEATGTPDFPASPFGRPAGAIGWPGAIGSAGATGPAGAIGSAGAIGPAGVADPAGVGDLPDGTPLARAMRRMARGALLGARGNSGVIVSQILRGMADSLAASAAVRGAELARALRSASEAAYSAVARPVEGTVLSVVAAAAEAAARIKSDDLLAVARAAARAASEALARTPQQLPALARAGVVDAGGRGLCLLLDALVEALTPAGAHDEQVAEPDNKPGPTKSPSPGGTPLPAASSVGGDPALEGRSASSPAGLSSLGGGPSLGGDSALGGGGSSLGDDRASGDRPAGLVVAREAGTGEGEYGYEVQYLLDAEPEAVDGLRRVLDALGDSLVVVGSGGAGRQTWNVHVHVGARGIGPAVEAGVEAGRPHRISVTPLDDRGHGPGEAERPASGRGAVVVAAGEGLTSLFEAEGATVVGRNPSTREMLEAITASGARCVVLLPNDANTHAVAVSAAREAEAAGVRVSVVPTRSPVQALAALAVRDPERSFADDVIAMAEAAGACRYGEVCTAQRDSLTVAGPCRAGDLLGLVDGEVHVIGDDVAAVGLQLLDRMLGGGGELVTLVLGADAPDGLEDKLRAYVTRAWPFVELHSYAGGQPRYHLLVGVE